LQECANVMCFNRKVLIGLGAVAFGVLVVAPQLLSRMLPLLFVAACPLSMVLMMRGMSGNSGQCTNEGASRPGVSHEAEIARLRAEIERLRHEHDPAATTPLASVPPASEEGQL
jgi:hypothetical protein